MGDNQEFFIVLEIQKSSQGTKAVLSYTFDIFNDAVARYYTICAAAAVSTLPYHGVTLMSSIGNVLKQEFFIR